MRNGLFQDEDTSLLALTPRFKARRLQAPGASGPRLVQNSLRGLLAREARQAREICLQYATGPHIVILM